MPPFAFSATLGAEAICVGAIVSIVMSSGGLDAKPTFPTVSVIEAVKLATP